MMAGPRLNRFLTLEDPARIADGAGGFSESWVALGTLWGEITPRGGSEAQDGSRVRYKIVLRSARPGDPSRPKPSQRLRELDRLFHIEAVTEAPDLPGHLLCFAYEETAA